MQARKVAVEDHDVVRVQVELGGGVQAVVRDVDRHALVAQALGDHRGEGAGVLDDQHPHAGTATAAGSATVTTSPPAAARGQRDRSPPCAAATAATMDSPSPVPAAEPGPRPAAGTAGPAAATSAASSTGPPVSTTSARPRRRPTVDPDPAAGVVVPDRVVDHVADHPGQQRRLPRDHARRESRSDVRPGRDRRPAGRAARRRRARPARPRSGRPARRAARGPAASKPSSSRSIWSSSARIRSASTTVCGRHGRRAWPSPRPATRAWWPAGCAARARRWRRTGAARRTTPPAVPAARRWCRRASFTSSAGPGHGQPLVQVVGGDPPGRGGDRPQRAQHPAGRRPGPAADAITSIRSSANAMVSCSRRCCAWSFSASARSSRAICSAAGTLPAATLDDALPRNPNAATMASSPAPETRNIAPYRIGVTQPDSPCAPACRART